MAESKVYRNIGNVLQFSLYDFNVRVEIYCIPMEGGVTKQIHSL